jgi:putative transposase
MTSTVELRIGSRVWVDGTAWVVIELERCSVRLSDGSAVRSLAISELMARVRVMDGRADDEPTDLGPIPVVLGSLTARDLARLEERARHVRELLADQDTRSLAARYQCKATELSVSVRTLERWVARYRFAGVAGLADSRVLRRYSSGVDPRWDAACLRVLDNLTQDSTPTMNAVISRVARELTAEFGVDVVPVPSKTTAYERLTELTKGRYSFGSAKARRSVAERPKGVFGRLRATRPGEYVVLDTTPLDVYAMEPVTLRWVPVELTVVMDLFTRCVLGLRLTPVSTKSQDVANVLYQTVTVQRSSDDDDGAAVWPFHGVPRNLLVGTEEPDGVSQQRIGGLPACVPEAIVVDHGRQYLSNHVIGVCARLGITIQPAIPHKPTDKPNLERFFRTLRESLLQHLPAYKGPDVYSRGRDVEDKAFYYVAELEQIIREWVGTVYHYSKHDGLCVPELPHASFSPAEMFEVGVARAGCLTLPAREGLAYEFLDVAWRTIQHYGVEVNGQRYNGPGLNLRRNARSPYTGMHAGKWPIMFDVHDVRFVYFQNPDTKQWHQLEWEHAAGLGTPFSQDAADYAKRVSIRQNRHVDPEQAVHDLLTDWSRGAVTERRNRALARKLSAQRKKHNDPEVTDRDAASEVVDLLARRDARTADAAPLEVEDDLDVFDAYYAARPEGGLEVYDG